MMSIPCVHMLHDQLFENTIDDILCFGIQEVYTYSHNIVCHDSVQNQVLRIQAF